MTLRKYLLSVRAIESVEQKKMFCPFHQDTKPSAYVNPNSIYCFSCARLFFLDELEEHFHVRLEEDESEKYQEEDNVFQYLMQIPSGMKE
jgi:DNA primase